MSKISNIITFLNENIDNFLNILSLIVTSIVTYIITKYTIIKPKKLEIKQLQFEKVYLPIFKLIRKDLSNEIDQKTAINYSIKIKSILLNNYELAYPQLHKLNDSFFKAVKENSNYQEFFSKICYQVNLDYLMLKKDLGYPSESGLGIFNRMTKKDKFSKILEWVNLLLIFIPLVIVPMTFTSIDLYTIMKFIISYLVLLFILIKLNALVNKMKH